MAPACYLGTGRTREQLQHLVRVDHDLPAVDRDREDRLAACGALTTKGLEVLGLEPLQD